MNAFEKSKSIKDGLRQSFRDRNSKIVQRKCYGYTVGSNGKLIINPGEAQVVRWIFERYLSDDSLGKITAGLERQGVLSPTGKLKWNREAIDKLLPNEKYTGRVLLQKTISTGISQIENNGLMCIFTSILVRPLFLPSCLPQSNRKTKAYPQNHKT